MNLTDLGFDPHFASLFEQVNRDPECVPAQLRGCVPARVGAQWRGLYRLLGEFGERAADVSGRFRHQAACPAEFPAVGDWVVAQVEADRAVIHAVLPRRSRFARIASGLEPVEQIAAANVDTVFLVAGLDGDFKVRRLERYLAMAWDGGASPVIVLNKADACDDVPGAVAACEAVAFGVPIHAISARLGTGLDALDAYLQRGRTVALLGSSGVGKSTLLNDRLGEERQRTVAVRADDSHGRHTTTARELFLLPGGGIVIDTPGMRELALTADAGAVDSAFADVEELAARCRFRDCEHLDEPDCAVLAALDAGELARDRYDSFHKLRREALFREAQVNVGLHQAQKEKVKRMHREFYRASKKRT